MEFDLTDTKKVRENLKVSPKTHREIKVTAANLGVGMNVLVERAWREFYQSHFEAGIPLEHDNSTQPPPSPVPVQIQHDTLSESEQEAVALLLLILRQGSKTVKQAIDWNLQGFAEPIQSRETKRGNSTGGARQVTEISEAIGDLIQSVETVGNDEAARRKWVEGLKRIQEEIGQTRRAAPKPRKPRGK